MNVRTRMAPSPTGEYHIGHIRTLLYNWAFARKFGGEFILRIEDTDQRRKVKGAVAKIMSVIKDYGFDWDEGPDVGGPHSPYIQSERLPLYEKYAKELVEKKKAYYCFCSSERLAKVRARQRAKKLPITKYDRRCRGLTEAQVSNNLKEERECVIRLLVPDNKKIYFHDVILGDLEFDSSALDDQVLLKSDGFPTYHLAVVVDDHLMKITHIMRGSDWISSTPKHVLLYEAFGWDMPKHAHLPNLKELGGNQKLSKRFGPVSAREFLKDGYLVEALVNFIMLLGWNPGGNKEILSLEEFIKEFEIEKVHKTDLISFDRNKLDWMNGEYIRNTQNSNLKSIIYNYFGKKYDEEQIGQIVPLIKTRIKKLSEFEEIAGFFFEAPKRTKISAAERKHIGAASEALEDVEWRYEKINAALVGCIKKNNFKTGKFFMSLRAAIAGSKVTPPLSESMVILGKKETIERLKIALK